MKLYQNITKQSLKKLKKNPEFIQMCQIEMAKALNDYPLTVAEYMGLLQKINSKRKLSSSAVMIG